jgi:hypothetical protein
MLPRNLATPDTAYGDPAAWLGMKDPNFGYGDHSRLSGGVEEIQLGPRTRFSAAMLARALADR